jgi:cupin superfamily acireductone dioxygenase involved in methionine salvage
MLAAPAAAAYLGIGTFAMRHLHWDSKVRGVFIGRKLLFDLRDLDKYVDSLKAAA